MARSECQVCSVLMWRTMSSALRHFAGRCPRRMSMMTSLATSPTGSSRRLCLRSQTRKDAPILPPPLAELLPALQFAARIHRLIAIKPFSRAVHRHPATVGARFCTMERVSTWASPIGRKDIFKGSIIRFAWLRCRSPGISRRPYLRTFLVYPGFHRRERGCLGHVMQVHASSNWKSR